MVKKIISHVIVGIGIAFIITVIMLNIFTRDRSGAEVLDSAILWLIAGGFYGLASMLYDTKLSKPIVVPLHFLANMAISIVSMEMMFRFIFKIKIDFSYLFIILIFTIVYIIISTCIYLYERLDIQKINKKLNEKEN